MRHEPIKTVVLIGAVVLGIGCADRAKEERDRATIAHLRTALTECSLHGAALQLEFDIQPVANDEQLASHVAVEQWDTARDQIEQLIAPLSLDAVQVRDVQGKVQVDAGKRVDGGGPLQKGYELLSGGKAGKRFSVVVPYGAGSYVVARRDIVYFGAKRGEVVLARAVATPKDPIVAP